MSLFVKKIEHTDRISHNNLSEEYKNVIEKSVKLSDEITETFESALYNEPTELYIRDYDGEKFYELSLQPSYKGVGIQCLDPLYSNSTIKEDEGDNALMTESFDVRFLYDSNLNIYYFVSCNSYTPVKAESIDQVISFKGACDILESELSSNVNIDFDDVKLWYEPRGKILSFDDYDGSKTIKCTPKWYFIVDEESDFFHTISYVTVDCVTGEIEVVLP